MDIRFIALPDSEAATKSVRLAKRFGKLGGHYFVVDNKKFFAHVTLFKGRIKGNRLSKVYTSTGESLKGFKQIKLHVERYHCEKGYLTLKIRDSKDLSTIRAKLSSKMKVLKSAELKIKRNFRPHITLTRFLDHRLANQVVSKENGVGFPFQIKKLAIALSDDQGQVYKILKEFKLK